MNGQDPAPVLVISAPSGVGKTSLIRRLMKDNPWISVAISHTTRSPRATEINGREYHFVTGDEFDRLREFGAFIETAEVFGHSYGVTWQALKQARIEGELVIIEIDWQGARSVDVAGIRNKSVFILPPSKEAQERRLKSRAEDSQEVMRERLRQTHDDCTHYYEFDYQILNDDFDVAASYLQQICVATRDNKVLSSLPDVKNKAEELIFNLARSINQ
ncbi:MAG: guanylate kinase [Gammaproteobacteria bacterium]|nr:guanylate kinase [Gammaproteobacteria bacterium]